MALGQWRQVEDYKTDGSVLIDRQTITVVLLAKAVEIRVLTDRWCSAPPTSLCDACTQPKSRGRRPDRLPRSSYQYRCQHAAPWHRQPMWPSRRSSDDYRFPEAVTGCPVVLGFAQTLVPPSTSALRDGRNFHALTRQAYQEPQPKSLQSQTRFRFVEGQLPGGRLSNRLARSDLSNSFPAAAVCSRFFRPECVESRSAGSAKPESCGVAIRQQAVVLTFRLSLSLAIEDRHATFRWAERNRPAGNRLG